MKKEDLAAKLDGAQYGDVLNGISFGDSPDLVVVFGDSDDLCEFEGAISEELSCYYGGIFTFTKEGKFVEEEEMAIFKKFHIDKPLYTIEAVWSPKKPFYLWIYKTEIPHATFNVYKDDELYCIGIVFSVNDLK